MPVEAANEQSTFPDEIATHLSGILISVGELKIFEAVISFEFMSISGLSNSDFENVDYAGAEIEYAFFYLNEPGTEYDTVAPDPSRDILNTDSPKTAIQRGAPSERPDFTPHEAYAAMTRGGADHSIESGKIFTIDVQYGGLLGSVVPGDDYANVNVGFDPNIQPPVEPTMTVTSAKSMIEVRDELMLNIGAHHLGIAPKINFNSRRFGAFINGELVSEKSGSDMIILSHSTPENFDWQHAKPTIAIGSQEKYGWYALFDNNNTTFRVRTISNPIAIPFDSTLNAQQQYGFTFRIEYEAIDDLKDNSECMTTFLNDFNTMNQGGNAWKVALAFILTAKDFFWEHPEYPSDQYNTHEDGSVWINGLLSSFCLQTQ